MLSRRGRDGSSGDASRATARPTGRRAGSIALTCYAVFLAWVLLWPSAEPASATVQHTVDVLHSLGVSSRLVTGSRVEFALNALMIAPVPLLAAWAGARWSWERWTAYAFVASAAIEIIQGLALPNRSAQFPDVAANTLGVLLGAMLIRLLVRPPQR